jgi:hypothetical protein
MRLAVVFANYVRLSFPQYLRLGEKIQETGLLISLTGTRARRRFPTSRAIMASNPVLSTTTKRRFRQRGVKARPPKSRGSSRLAFWLLRLWLIDQPEENLDPQSVFVDLVPHFRQARKDRQVIIVTHNANLVVNTDADQVIVATCESASAGSLPLIKYKSGSLENPDIRRSVWWIARDSLKSSRDSHCYCCLNWSNVFEKLGQQPQSLMRIAS